MIILYHGSPSSQAMETQAQLVSAVKAITALVASTHPRPLSTPAGPVTSAPWAAPFLNAAPMGHSSSTQMHTTATFAPQAIIVTPTQVSTVSSILPCLDLGGSRDGKGRGGGFDVEKLLS